MKHFLLFSILMILNIEFARAQEAYLIQPVEIKNPLLVQAIADYITEWSDVLQNHGVIDLTCDVSNDNYYIGYMLFKSEVIKRPPTFFMKINGKVILIYTGFEKQLTFQSKSFDKLFKVAGKDLGNSAADSLYDPVIWKISFSASSYSKDVVTKVPPLYK